MVFFAKSQVGLQVSLIIVGGFSISDEVQESAPVMLLYIIQSANCGDSVTSAREFVARFMVYIKVKTQT